MPWTRSGACLVLLAFAGPSLAQTEPESSATGTLRGIVSAVDWPAGTVSIGVTGLGGVDRTVVLNARPLDLVGLNPGDVVTAPFADYAGLLWLVPDGPPVDPGPGAFSSTGTFTGPVAGVDKRRGLLAMRGGPLRAHPEDLEDLLPGQFVSVSWTDIGGVRWIVVLQGPESPPEASPSPDPVVAPVPTRGRPGRGSPRTGTGFRCVDRQLSRVARPARAQRAGEKAGSSRAKASR